MILTSNCNFYRVEKPIYNVWGPHIVEVMTIYNDTLYVSWPRSAISQVGPGRAMPFGPAASWQRRSPRANLQRAAVVKKEKKKGVDRMSDRMPDRCPVLQQITRFTRSMDLNKDPGWAGRWDFISFPFAAICAKPAKLGQGEKGEAELQLFRTKETKIT